jgi:hypothetical protein
LPKGDRGGFYCAFFFPKITAAYLLYEQNLTIPPAQQVGFESTKFQQQFRLRDEIYTFQVIDVESTCLLK